ncbi:CHAD domain-containing protein [Pelagicoccus albus]|uniref:CHAD domain-containing protein n=1 Tax=Pelagicoccus albus TaxID=415222 RepID=A0A7X1B2Q5_9BACT|nr:CHAD domain-containing protein [Pelagicoccus albus]MBC2604561.1 CHAD domain-containing protein [Pelagicoccus albus]
MTLKPSTLEWQLDENPSLLFEQFGEKLQKSNTPPIETSLELYDTFDQALREIGRCLIKEKSEFRIADRVGIGSTSPELRSRTRGQNIFWNDFPAGELRDYLKPLLELRAAVKVATIKILTEEYSILNEDEKTVARLRLTRLTEESSGQSTQSLATIPLVGYTEEAQEIASILDTLTGFHRKKKCSIEWVFNAVGAGAPPLSPSATVQLDSDQSTQSAVVEIAKQMVHTASQMEDGVIKDIDTEFLHDYRVSIRKLRSVLSLTKGAFAKDDLNRLKTAFGGFARKTSRLRDLDVYLMEKELFRSMLPRSLHPGLDPLFEFFAKERSRELTKIRRHLKSAAYTKSIESQLNWLSQEELPQGPASETPIKPFASHIIAIHYKRVRKMGKKLDDTTPDEEVHELRIECKKLRYLLELFSSLYPTKDIKRIIKQLKGLQTVLGNFNDYTVQQQSLLQYLSETESVDRAAAASVGGLITHLHRSQLEARSHVSEKFLQFHGKETRLLFEKLFNANGKAST